MHARFIPECLGFRDYCSGLILFTDRARKFADVLLDMNKYLNSVNNQSIYFRVEVLTEQTTTGELSDAFVATIVAVAASGVVPSWWELLEGVISILGLIITTLVMVGLRRRLTALEGWRRATQPG